MGWLLTFCYKLASITLENFAPLLYEAPFLIITAWLHATWLQYNSTLSAPLLHVQDVSHSNTTKSWNHMFFLTAIHKRPESTGGATCTNIPCEAEWVENQTAQNTEGKVGEIMLLQQKVIVMPMFEPTNLIVWVYVWNSLPDRASCIQFQIVLAHKFCWYQMLMYSQRGQPGPAPS